MTLPMIPPIVNDTEHIPAGIDKFGNETSVSLSSGRTQTHLRPAERIPGLPSETYLASITEEQRAAILGYQGPTMAEVISIDSRRKAVASLADAGLAIPSPVTEAMAVYDVLVKTNPNVVLPDIGALSAPEAPGVLRAYVEAVSVQLAFREARNVFLRVTVDRLRQAMTDALDSVLPQLTDPYAEQAEVFRQAYEKVQGIRSLNEAARADSDGSTVVAWHRAQGAARELERQARLVADFNRKDSLISRRAEDEHTFACLLADYADAYSVRPVWSLPERHKSGRVTDDSTKGGPFGLFAPIVDSGARLALPTSHSEWLDRVEVFNARRESEALAFFSG